MSIPGITTVVSQSPIPEKVAEVMDRAAENRQVATAAVVQEENQKDLTRVQRTEKVDKVNAIRKRDPDEEEDIDRRKKKKHRKSGNNLDLKA